MELQAGRQCVCATLRKASRRVTQVFDQELRASGLRATQFHILAEVRAGGEATVTRLAKSLAMDQTTLTRSLLPLEREGLLESVPKPDGRLKSVRLTKKGKAAIAAAHPLWEAAQKRMLEAIGAEAWPLLKGELDKVTSLGSGIHDYSPAD